MTGLTMWLLSLLPVYGVWAIVALLALLWAQLVARPEVHWARKYYRMRCTARALNEDLAALNEDLAALDAAHVAALARAAAAEQAVIILQGRLAAAEARGGRGRCRTEVTR